MAKKIIAWTTGTGNITLTYTGQGNGTIQVDSDANNLGSARSQVITVETTHGGVVTKNLTINQAACPFPVGTTKNYSYTGSYQEVELPAGSYKLQCWGAQGGSNDTNPTYGITAKKGGKGGYSEGVITLSQKTTVRVYVGGQGSASAGGFNGGGDTYGTSQYHLGDTFGYSKMGGGGGATDIRLSDGALLSRMIVAGGGSGGAMCYKNITTTETTISGTKHTGEFILYGGSVDTHPSMDYYEYNIADTSKTYKVKGFGVPSGGWSGFFLAIFYSGSTILDYELVSQDTVEEYVNSYYTLPFPSGCNKVVINTHKNYTPICICEETITTTSTDDQVGYAGGGTNGAGYSSLYCGRQNGAGSGGSFGQGANQTTTNYRYCSGAGGGGWYGGGGGQYSDNDMNTVHLSGGGSGFVNTAASAGNRPSGYTGLELDSGTLYAGNQSFPAPSGGNETGHSGNGYARITRLE